MSDPMMARAVTCYCAGAVVFAGTLGELADREELSEEDVDRMIHDLYHWGVTSLDQWEVEVGRCQEKK
jgi:hypothetical protein